MAFDPVYVVGGRQRRPRGITDNGDGWYGYGSGVILRVSPESVETVVEYVSPPEACGSEDPVLFKSATRRGDVLFCTTQTEVVIYRLPDFEQIGYLSLPVFNDLHHVIPYRDDSVLVANSGLESVMQIAADGSVIDEWNVLGEDTWSSYDRDVDYRQGVDLKPHRGHPNHLLLHDGDVWVSRFEQRDLAALSDLANPIELGGERIHDGAMHGGRAYLTMVDGHIVEVDLAARAVCGKFPLHPPDDPDQMLGWCRGLHFTDSNECWVGFSRIRPTKLRQTVQWIRARGTVGAATRIDLFDTANWQLVHSIELEQHGLNAVFSVLPAGPLEPELAQKLYG